MGYHKKVSTDTGSTIIDKNNLFIEYNKQGYYFNCTRKELGIYGLDTMDAAEATAALMLIPKYNNEQLWNIPLKKNTVNHSNILYWLFYNINGFKWHQVADYYVDEYSTILKKCIKNSKTMGDLRDAYYREFNVLDKIEFTLSQEIAFDSNFLEYTLYNKNNE